MECYDIDEEILLGREGVNPDKPDNYCRTRLSHATSHGQKEVVKALPGQEELKADKLDDYG